MNEKSTERRMEKIYKSGKTEFSKEKRAFLTKENKVVGRNLGKKRKDFGEKREREKMKRARGEASNKIKTGYFAVFIILTSAILFNLAFANAAYQPPLYIANPETGECQYYFAGEADCFDACMNDCQGAGLNYTNCMEPCANKYCHYNLKPEGFTADIGKTADFESVNESCKAWQDCIGKNGEWNSTSSKCQLKAEEKAKSSDFLATAGIAISITALIAIILIYLKIRKMLKQIHAEKK